MYIRDVNPMKRAASGLSAETLLLRIPPNRAAEAEPYSRSSDSVTLNHRRYILPGDGTLGESERRTNQHLPYYRER